MVVTRKELGTGKSEAFNIETSLEVGINEKRKKQSAVSSLALRGLCFCRHNVFRSADN